MTNKLETGLRRSGMSLPFMNVRGNMGATVIARIAAPISENVFVRTWWLNILNYCPVRNKIGANEMIIMMTEKNTERPIIFDDSLIISTRSSSEISFVLPIRSFTFIICSADILIFGLSF